MDSGLAALLGAAVGSAATLGAAIVNGRAQARSQHAQQSRQHRRDARYLSALHDRDLAMDAVLDALRPDRPDLTTVEERTARFVTLAREVHRTCEEETAEPTPPPPSPLPLPLIACDGPGKEHLFRPHASWVTTCGPCHREQQRAYAAELLARAEADPAPAPPSWRERVAAEARADGASG
ncbi:hypothetical protein ABZ362_22515 [Streptomyces sp. NPDC005951]|uniref:hypothetical protein n=1 Tax=Streptomyces sp. NPDC005951 TaxID=3154573 RepID=UPI0033E5430B